MIVQIKSGRSTNDIGAFQFAILQNGGGTSDYFNIDPPGPNSFNTYDVTTTFGVMDARGVRFLFKGNLGCKWQLEFVNVLDRSVGIWRWEPHMIVPINQFPDLWHMYDVGELLVGGYVPPDTHPCGYWVSPADHREFCT